MGFFCSVHCKLEQLNYSSFVAVIKYGDGPRDVETLNCLSSGKGAWKGVLIPQQLLGQGGSSPALTQSVMCVLCVLRGSLLGSFSALFLPCLGPGQSWGDLSWETSPGLGAAAVIPPMIFPR